MGNTLLNVSNLSIGFGDNSIISDASFTLNEGDVVLLEGSNGTGKSTLLKAMIGMCGSGTTIEGMISISGSTNVLTMSERELLKLRSGIGYLEQKDAYDMYSGITVKDVLADSLEAYKDARLTKDDYSYIDEVFNKYIPAEANFTLKSKVNKLSGGQQRMMSIIASLCLRNDSSFFIIDEPLNNLDINTIVHISNILNTIRLENPRALMIIVSHCKIFPFISKVATIKNGMIEISDSEIVCNACFGTPNTDGFYV